MNALRPTAAGPSARSRLSGLLPPLLAALVAGCAGPQSALIADGPAAAVILPLLWALTALSVFVVVLVVVTLVMSLRGRRAFHGTEPPLGLSHDFLHKLRADKPIERGAADDVPIEQVEQRGAAVDADARAVSLVNAGDGRRMRWVLLGGLVFPLVVLVPLLGLTLGTMRGLGGGLGANGDPGLVLEVIGHQYWWEVRYLDGDGRVLFETANEIHLPVGRAVELRLEASDVIHSFWVPRLAGKLDMIPGRTNVLRLRADVAGEYRGQCAEYCGLQHARMSLLVVAQPEAEYAAWAAAQALPVAAPADALATFGRDVFLGHACRACHTIRGTPAIGELGPDLTHVASRQMLAALTVPNTRGHLGGWIANPQDLKPGSRMPSVPLEQAEFNALLHYLGTLR
jgi:cytochrome c oxidase subunit II